MALNLSFMHEEVLTFHARKLFPLLSQFKEFYLVGGTALALQIGHRVSVDFDMFTRDELSAGLLQKIKKVFHGHSISLTYQSVEQINLIISDVKFTFFSYPYPVRDPYVMYHGVPLASIREIAAMKALAVGRRLAYKDYVDWYFLLKEERIDIGEIVAFAKKKFSSDFNDRLFLGQLSSFEDVPTQTIDFFGKAVSRKIIKAFITKTVKQYINAM